MELGHSRNGVLGGRSVPYAGSTGLWVGHLEGLLDVDVLRRLLQIIPWDDACTPIMDLSIRLAQPHFARACSNFDPFAFASG